MPGRVVLAMSGGVDSSVAAVLLKRQGYDVVGLFMRTGVAQPTNADTRDRKKGCCSAVDAGDARRVADRLDIPFYALDFEDDFDRIIDYFADEYLRGRTPNPCVVCNTWLKFGKLWTFAQAARRRLHRHRPLRPDRAGAGGPELHKGLDPDKDQSYVLYGIAARCCRTCCSRSAATARRRSAQLAREAGLGVADKPDSVEICFVPDGDHAAVIRRRRPERGTAGDDRRRRRATSSANTTASSGSRSASGRGWASAAAAPAVRAGDRPRDARGRRRRARRSCLRRGWSRRG